MVIVLASEGVNFGQPTSKIVANDLLHVSRLYVRHNKSADMVQLLSRT